MVSRSLRRLTALTLAAAATAALGAGCGSSSDDDNGGGAATAASSGGGGDTPVVGFINGSSVEFNMCVSRGLKAGLGDAAELNEVNSRDDVGAEVSNGEDLLARKPDALVLQTVNVQSGAQIVDKANGDDVPVFLSSVDFVRDPSKVAGAVVFDNGATGAKIGGYLAEQVRAGSDDEVKVGIVAGAPGAASDFLIRGFKGALAAAPNAKVVFEQPGMWNRGKAASVAENMIQAQPDLDYVLVSNEDMAFGVLKSLQAAGKDGQVKILTNGGTELGLRAVEDGEFLSTTDASPFQIGFRTGRAVLDQLDGRRAAEPVQTLPVQVITRDNAADAAAYCAAS